MSIVSFPGDLNRAQSSRVPGHSGLAWGVPVAVTIGGLLALATTLGKAVAVWRTGIFFDPDDAMRAVEVRDFLNGQGWFDLIQHRLSPDHPFAMHWSRLADLPLAASALIFGYFTDPDTAERITRLLEPSLFYVVFLAAVAGLGRGLVGERGPLSAALLASGSLEIVSNFVPGHIHHHALQLMLLALLVKLFCDGLDPARAGRMTGAGVWAALSLAINLQNLPFVMAAGSILGLMWVRQGAPLARALGRFGWGLLGGGTAVFLLQVPPSRYFEASCDAFSAPHLLALTAASAWFVALAAASPRLGSAGTRLAGLCAACGSVLLLMRLAYPDCLGDPYAAVDPLIRERWMGEVGEAMPLAGILARDPWGTIPIVIALGLGMGGAVQAARRETGLTGARWIAVTVLGLVGIAGTLWQIRVASSAAMFASIGGASWLCRSFGPQAPARRYGMLLCVLAGLGLTQAGWTFALSIPRSFASGPIRSARGLPPIDPDACFAPGSYDTLRGLPTGLVLSTIDPGAHILAYTAHSALAAPYHRDSYGIRVALLAFEAPPEAARALILGARVRYLALCTTSPRDPRDRGPGPEWLRGADPRR